MYCSTQMVLSQYKELSGDKKSDQGSINEKHLSCSFKMSQTGGSAAVGHIQNPNLKTMMEQQKIADIKANNFKIKKKEKEQDYV